MKTVKQVAGGSVPQSEGTFLRGYHGAGSFSNFSSSSDRVLTVSAAWTRTGRWLRSRTTQDPRLPPPQAPACPSLVTFFTQPLPGAREEQTLLRTVVFMLSEERASGASQLRMWSVANNSNSCSWRWLPGQRASWCHCRSQGLSGLLHGPGNSP